MIIRPLRNPFVIFLVSLFSIPTFASSFKDSTTIDAKNNHISFGVKLFALFPIETAQSAGFEKPDLANFGAEILYNYNLKRQFHISSGLDYLMGSIKNSSSTEKISFKELCVPILITKSLSRTESTVDFSLTTGFYFGNYLDSSFESKGGKFNPNNNWIEFRPDYTKEYSDSDFISDFYFGINYAEPGFYKNFFQVSLYSRYRLVEHWTNYEVSRFLIGFKISYFLKV